MTRNLQTATMPTRAGQAYGGTDLYGEESAGPRGPQ